MPSRQYFCGGESGGLNVNAITLPEGIIHRVADAAIVRHRDSIDALLGMRPKSPQ
jgi:hypothetical protein